MLWVRALILITSLRQMFPAAVGEAISRAARKRKGELARPLSDWEPWMPQSCLLAVGGQGSRGVDTGVGVSAA